MVLWAVVIVVASGDTKSAHRSSRLLEPFLRWLFPEMSNEALWSIIMIARKWAHLTEYGILALFVWHGLRGTFWAGMETWSRRCAFSAWTVCFVYAITDEVHQTFVPGRQGSVWDVLIDSIGAALALFGLWLVRWKWFPRREQHPISTGKNKPTEKAS